MGLDIIFQKKNKSYDAEKADKLEKQIAKLDKKYKTAKTEATKQKILDKLSPLYKEEENNKKYLEVLYFRKVNFLLPFFNYEDNCSVISITKEQVEELVKRCNYVLDIYNDLTNNDKELDCFELYNKVRDILPTQAGFFFGTTDYNEWYIKAIEYVKDEFEKLLNDFDFENEELFMTCWW